MSAFPPAQHPIDARPAASGRTPAALAALPLRLGEWRRARATAAALARLSDRELADIGLHRGAIPEVAAALARRR